MSEVLTLRYWNPDQTFKSACAPSPEDLWPEASPHDVKAALWDTDGPTLSLANGRPATILADLGLLPTNHTTAPVPSVGDRDASSKSRSIRTLLESLDQTQHIIVAPAVWTNEAKQIVNLLQNAGFSVSSETDCPPGRVFDWNTRVGMRELFRSISELSPMIIPSCICWDESKVRSSSSELGNDAVVIKSNRSFGGVGSAILDLSDRFDFSLLDESNALLGSKKLASKYNAWHSWERPFVVEKLVGDLSTNLSITVDAKCLEADKVEILGCSEQILLNNLQYCGIRNYPNSLDSDVISKIHYAVRILGAALGSRQFSGYFNVDFCVTADSSIFIADLNVRRSYPLDAHMLLRRINSVAPEKQKLSYRHWDSLVVNTQKGASLEEVLDNGNLLYSRGSGALPISLSQSELGQTTGIASIMLVETDELAVGELENATLTVLQ